MPARNRTLVVALVCVLAGLAAALAPAQARPLPHGQDPFVAGAAYSGDFPDPAVLRVGRRYYAYSTTTAGLNLPMMSSRNLRTWVARPTVAGQTYNDALPRTPVWSAGVSKSGGRFRAPTWAPSVARVGGRYVLAYATQVAGVPGQHMCISLASATSPYGPFVDSTSAPTLCPAHGAIDPQIFKAPTGRPWLLWKLDHHPAMLFIKPMNLAGTALLKSPSRYLTRIARPWEGNIIENPAMIRWRKRFYLFYSANSYASPRYAIGYLICRTLRGRCHRPSKHPLLATGGGLAGPGGGTPFVDAAGRLRLAYHAWRAGRVGYPGSAVAGNACRTAWPGCGQRRLYVATLRARPDGTLIVVRRR